MLKRVNAAAIFVVLLNASLAIAQTNSTKKPLEGVWELDLKQSVFNSEVRPKSGILNILRDTPDAMSWRYDEVDHTGKSLSYLWSGPIDGSMQDLKGNDGQVIAKASMKRDDDAVLRHTEVPDVGVSDSRAIVSADGNTITDVTTMKSKDGETSNETAVYHRVVGAKPASK
jgi:hypothetical protein